MYEFYYPDGKKIASPNDFIDYYSRAYYLCNSSESERIAISILEKQKKDPNQELSKEEIYFILSWKTGATMYPDIPVNGIYKGDSLMYFDEVSARSVNIKIEDVKKVLPQIIKYDKLEEYIEKLCTVKGIGNTYAVALTYFASGGRFMIYDQFADRARTAIKNKFSPINMEQVTKQDIMSVNISKCVEILEIYYEDLNEIFGESYDGRRVDQALWTYGHLFKGVK